MIERPRWAWEELQPGDLIQDKDEWQNEDGRWHPLVIVPGASTQVRDGLRARRPYKISTLLEIGDALANAQKAATQLQDERDEARKAVTQMMAQLTNQAEVLAEVRADEKRLFDDLELLRSEYIKLQADRDKLQGLIDDLVEEPTARQVQDMLRTWATELDWSSGCFGSFGRSQIDIIQQTMVAVMERIETMINPEATSAND